MLKKLEYIAQLASPEAQETNATENDVMPEDLVVEVLSSVEVLLEEEGISPEQKRSLSELKQGIESLGYEFWCEADDHGHEVLIYQNPLWQDLIARAENILQDFGYRLDHFDL